MGASHGTDISTCVEADSERLSTSDAPTLKNGMCPPVSLDPLFYLPPGLFESLSQIAAFWKVDTFKCPELREHRDSHDPEAQAKDGGRTCTAARSIDSHRLTARPYSVHS